MKNIIEHIINFFKPDTYPVGLKSFKFAKSQEISKPKFDWALNSAVSKSQAYKSIQSFYNENV